MLVARDHFTYRHLSCAARFLSVHRCGLLATDSCEARGECRLLVERYVLFDAVSVTFTVLDGDYNTLHWPHEDGFMGIPCKDDADREFHIHLGLMGWKGSACTVSPVPRDCLVNCCA